MRHHEDDNLSSFRPGFKGADKGVGWGGAGFSQPFLSWRASSRGRGTLRSRIDAIPCGTDAAFLPRSCLGQDEPIISWPPAPPPPPVCSYPGGDIPPGDACARAARRSCSRACGSTRRGPDDAAAGRQTCRANSSLAGAPGTRTSIRTSGAAAASRSRSRWARGPTTRRTATPSTRFAASDWWNKRPKDITVNRWDADSGAWKKVRDFTYPGTSTKNVCGDGKTSFGGEECSCCGAGTHSHSFYTIDLDGVATEKLQLVVTSSWWSGGFLPQLRRRTPDRRLGAAVHRRRGRGRRRVDQVAIARRSGLDEWMGVGRGEREDVRRRRCAADACRVHRLGRRGLGLGAANVGQSSGAWGGRKDAEGHIWIGMRFASAVSVSRAYLREMNGENGHRRSASASSTRTVRANGSPCARRMKKTSASGPSRCAPAAVTGVPSRRRRPRRRRRRQTRHRCKSPAGAGTGV